MEIETNRMMELVEAEAALNAIRAAYWRLTPDEMLVFLKGLWGFIPRSEEKVDAE